MLGRFILLVFICLIGWRLWLAYRRSRTTPTAPPITTYQTVRCAYCQVHLPIQDAIAQPPNYFCCVEHQRAMR